MTERDLIDSLELIPHPEGGFYRETYRCAESVPQCGLPDRFRGTRSFSTAILFLLRAGDCSRLHRIQQDEIWHFYLGGPLRLVMITPEGHVREVILGQEISGGQKLQYAVPAGCWFGARPCEGAAFSLVGCTVAPGFSFEDFEMGSRSELVRLFPHAEALIRAFCPE